MAWTVKREFFLMSFPRHEWLCSPHAVRDGGPSQALALMGQRLRRTVGFADEWFAFIRIAPVGAGEMLPKFLRRRFMTYRSQNLRVGPFGRSGFVALTPCATVVLPRSSP